MTLVDTNLLVYATLADAPEHARARARITERFAEGEATVALCWPVVYAFLRLITSPRVVGEHAVTVKAGWRVADAYLEAAGRSARRARQRTQSDCGRTRRDAWAPER